MTVLVQKKMFIIASVAFVLLMTIAGLWDLQISNAFINYYSVFGTVFQTLGEFPVYMVLVLTGEIAMAYGFQVRDNPPLFK